MSIQYGDRIKLQHELTQTSLHSHNLYYGHPGTSGQQQVTAFAGSDDNDYWLVKGPDGQTEDYKESNPVQDGEIIRLQHIATGRNLHSHLNLPSPVTGQQEVTAFGNIIGDGNDDWRVEVIGGGTWDANKPTRLIHVLTDHALHSHSGFSHPHWTAGQQEVTCFRARDDNDLWSPFDISFHGLKNLPLIPVQAVEDVLSPYRQLIDCLIQAPWSLWRVGPGGDLSVPIGIKVCLGRTCANRLRDAADAKMIGALIADIGGLISGASVTALLTTISNVPWLAPGLSAIAGAIGMTLPQATMVFLGVLALVAVHTVLIAGQIRAWQAFGQARNGVCLNHPGLIVAASAFVTGPLAISAVNVPMVVTPR